MGASKTRPPGAKKAPRGAYEVGYCRPPRRACFKPGQSGNPTGRVTGSRNAKTIVEDVLSGSVTVLRDGKRERMTKFEAMLQAQLLKAIKGDTRAANLVMSTVMKTNSLAKVEDDGPVLSEEDAAIIDDYVSQLTTKDKKK